MTQHLSPEDTCEDQRTLHRLAFVVGCFIAFSLALAVGIGITVG